MEQLDGTWKVVLFIYIGLLGEWKYSKIQKALGFKTESFSSVHRYIHDRHRERSKGNQIKDNA